MAQEWRQLSEEFEATHWTCKKAVLQHRINKFIVPRLTYRRPGQFQLSQLNVRIYFAVLIHSKVQNDLPRRIIFCLINKLAVEIYAFE